MTDRKSLAIILGAAVGVATVAAAVGVYVSRHAEPIARDVNDVVEQARKTVAKLDKAVENIRRSAA